MLALGGSAPRDRFFDHLPPLPGAKVGGSRSGFGLCSRLDGRGPVGGNRCPSGAGGGVEPGPEAEARLRIRGALRLRADGCLARGGLRGTGRDRLSLEALSLVERPPVSRRRCAEGAFGLTLAIDPQAEQSIKRITGH